MRVIINMAMLFLLRCPFGADCPLGTTSTERPNSTWFALLNRTISLHRHDVVWEVGRRRSQPTVRSIRDGQQRKKQCGAVEHGRDVLPTLCEDYTANNTRRRRPDVTVGQALARTSLTPRDSLD